MKRRSVLLGVIGAAGLPGRFRPMASQQESDTAHSFPRLDVGGGFDAVPSEHQGLVNVFGSYPQVALQADSASKYNGINWYDPSGRQLFSLVVDVPDEDLSLYAKSSDGLRKAMDLDYSGGALDFQFKNTESFFVSGGGPESGSTVLGIEAGNPDGDSILRFVNGAGQSVWGLLQDASVDEAFRLFNYRSNRTALSVSAETDAIDFFGNPTVGLREIEDPTPDDLSPNEWAWDATDDRWLYRDDEGTVHYFEPDGTL